MEDHGKSNIKTFWKEGHCHAVIDGKEKIEAKGRSEDEALGLIVRQNQDFFKVVVEAN